MKARAEILDAAERAELAEYYRCHLGDVESLIWTLKLIGFLFIIMFLIYYSSLVANAPSEFRGGLYNSMWFDEGRCYGADDNA